MVLYLECYVDNYEKLLKWSVDMVKILDKARRELCVDNCPAHVGARATCEEKETLLTVMLNCYTMLL